MFNVSKLSRTARVPRSPRTTHVAPLMAHRTTGVLAALGIAAAGLAMTPPRNARSRAGSTRSAR